MNRAPSFTSDPSSNSQENQTSAYDADATDADGDGLTYTLSGTDAALFNIDANTGVVTFKTAPDFEAPADSGGDNVYNFTVTASDGTNSADQAVAVTVTNQNDNAPVFTSGTAASVAENQTSAYDADATDADGDGLTYSLSGTDAALFNIDANTGVVTFKAAPDFEAPADSGGDNVYNFTVTASDGTNSADQAVAVTVTNQNDNAPVFTSGTAASVAENQTSAYDADATDADGDAVTFSISGTDAALFNIDANTGVVTFKAAPDFEAPADSGGDNVYNFTVTASDGTNSADQAVAVTVTNQNDNAPAFTSGTAASVAENQTSAYDADATDADGDAVTFSISGTDAALFNIDANTGVVTFKAAPDFEAPADSGGDNVYNFTVTASDGTNSADQAVAVTVTNQNDNAPVFTSGTAASVAENQTSAYDADATDADGDAVTFSISGTDAALFNIDANTGVVTFKAAPDFEAPADSGGDNVYNFTVTASDGTNSADQAVAVTVTNQNDNAPAFTSGTAASVAENQTSAYDADATDADGDAVTFSISGTDAALFNIDANTGVVTFKAAPDFEAPADSGGDNVYNFTVTASDGTNSADQAVAVTVTNQNDNAPVFTSGTAASVAENQTSAYDADATDADGDAVTFSISGTDAALFNIDANTGVVTFKAAPDFEAPADSGGDNVYNFTVTASDGTNSADQAVAVTVTNQNDNAPAFTSGTAASVAENQTSAYDADATDADGDAVTFSISGTDAALFNIDANTGVVTFKAAPDFEAPADSGGDNVYNFTVTASDGTNSADQAVAVTVTNQNDNAPVFTSGTAASVAENQTSAYDADATDADGDAVTFSISGTDAALFNIDANTGVVTFKAAPDFEAPADSGGDNVYNFTVTASDGTNSADQAVAVTVTNQNDNAPAFTSGTAASVAENQTSAYDADATDADGDAVTFSISGTDAALFNIDANTGVVTFKAAPDFEAPADSGGDNVYNFTVTASDGTNSADQAVAVTVTNQNDNAPVFTSGTAASVAENQTSAYDADATDADGDGLTYSLSGTDAALFNIDANTGVVTFKTAPDFEAPADSGGDNVYNFTVTASDGTNSADQAVAVTVTNQNDNAPVFTSGTAASVAENQTSAYDADATDADGDGLTYSLSGTDAALFNIDANTGVVTFKAAPDFEAPADSGGDNVYNFTVTASDGTNSADQAVAVTVTNQNDNAPVFTSGTAASVAENQTSAYDADATDADGDGLTYSLSGTDAALFNIDANTGVVTFKAAPDFEAPADSGGDNVYNFTVTASDGTNSADQAVAVTVTNQNDNAPVFTSGTAASVAENQTSAYDADATDADGDAVTFSISGTDAALFNIDANTGVVTFKAAPDFEAPADSGGDNVYNFTVTASDGTNSADQAVAVTVTNQNDNAPAFTSGTAASVAENQTSAYDADASDADNLGVALTYTLSGTDAALFDIDANTGVVTFKTAPDFEAPADSGGDNVYNFTVTASDGTNSTDQAVAVTVTNQNDNAPVFTSGTAASVAENQTSAYDADASDADGDGLTYSLSGTDAVLFNIDANTGVVTFKTAPDFEAPADSGGDNVYNFTVTASDGTNSTDQAVTVTVTDVLEQTIIDSTTLTAAQGFIIQGDTAGDRAGFSVSNAGDVNGDGFDDLIVGAPFGDDGGGDAGEAYVIFGTAGGFGTTDGVGRQVIDLTSLTATQGFIIQGDTAGDRSGPPVASAGDINGDGFDDLIIGAERGDDGGSNAGEAYVIFGTAGGFGTVDGAGRQVIDLTSLTAAQGFIIQGDAADDLAGRSVSSAGDINGDGFDDLIVGAPFGDDGGNAAGEAYVVFGNASGFGANVGGRQVVDLTTLTAAQGFVIQGDAAGDIAGSSVSSAGDVNGDGFDDLIVGAEFADDGGSYAGEVYVVFGAASGFGTNVGGRQVIDLTALTAAQGFIILGDAAGDLAGRSVSSAGDVNGDGFDDLILGADSGDDGGDGAGEAYVVFGSASGFGSDVGGRQVIDLTTLTAAQGFIIQGDAADDRAGRSVSSAGDVNGDGFDDLIVGAPFGDDGGIDAGEAYVVFGTAGGFGTADGAGRQVIDLTTLTAVQGFIVQGDILVDDAGISVSKAGDVNGDGFDDLILGAPSGDDGGNNAGEGYVIFGGATGTEDATPITSIGTGAANNLIGNAGNDTLTGGGGADVIRGGAGNDTISIADLAFADIRGGNGSDTLQLAGTGLALDLTTTPLPRLESIETIDLTGTGNNSLTLNQLAVFNLSDNTSGGVTTLTVTGNAGDSVTIEGTGWTQDANTVVGATTFATFTNGAARLLVQDGVAVVATIDLSTLDGTNGFRLDGIDPMDRSGFSVAKAGDVNGDGFDDLIIGAFDGDPGGNSNAGESYVVFGKASGFSSRIDLSSLDGTNGFRLEGISGFDRSGRSVSNAGDINGDGFDDIIIGAYGSDVQAGESYVVFGKASGFGASIDLSTLDGTNGFRLDGIDAFDSSGWPVSSAGDINGDGFDDLIIGARGGDPGGNSDAGESYVLFGKASGFGARIDLSALDGTNGFRLDGIDAFDRSGYSVSSAGDVNGDGFDDLIIGAGYADPGGNSSAGESYVVFGKASGFGAIIDLSTLDGTNGFRLDGIDGGDYSGLSVSSAGDVNGDGFDDLIIGAVRGDPGGDSNAGESYVVFGKASGFGSSIDLSTLDGTNGFRLDGIDGGDFSGVSVARAGDINGDGFDDLVIGAQFADPGGNSNAGESYVVFGKASGFGARIDLSSLDGTNGFRLNGIDSGDRSGLSVSSAGDVNGDGFDDLIIGAAYADPDGDSLAGESYVVFGGANGTEDTNAVTSTGTAAGDNLIGNAGNDTLTGGGGADVIRGGAGDDTISIADLAFADIRGGNGSDTLQLAGTGLSLDLTTTPRPRIESIETIDLTGTGNNSLTLNQLAVFNLSDNTSGGVTTLTVTGNAGDSVTIEGTGWTQGTNTVVGTTTFATFTNGAARLLVQDGVTVLNPAPVTDLTSLTAAQGFVIQGDAANDLTGSSVSSAGDINSDGFDDLIVGAPNGDDAGGDAGEAYVAFGTASGFGTDVGGRQVIDLTTLTAAQGFIIQGDQAFDQAGRSVSSAGDVNGDGFDDLIIGAPFGDDGGTDAGEAFVVFGTAGGFGSAVGGRQVIDLTSLTAAQGFVIQGDVIGDQAGITVSSAGDVNGDGYDDLIVGARFGGDGGAGAGEAYVVFGTASGFGTDVGGRQVIDLTSLTSAQGFIIQGDEDFDQAGHSVSSVGDVNGDGFDDLIVGAERGDDGGTVAGEAYVVFGTAGGFGTDVGGRQVIDLTSLTAAQGFIIQGDEANDFAGSSVSSAGDVNGDGFDDLIVGARFGSDGGSGAGEAYVVFGSASGFGANVGGRQVIDLTSLTAAQGFIIQGDVADDRAGRSVSSAGDINGDGFDDLIVGAANGDDGGSDAGEAYVIFGSASGFGSADGAGRQIIDLTSLTAAQGFIIEGDGSFDQFGFSVSSAGDVNGDGFDDLIVGARLGDDGGNNAGEAYVIFGGATGTESTVAVTRTGTAAADNLIGNAGNDTLTGGGGADVIRGGAGDDTISIADLAFAAVDGGNGSDTLQLSGTGLSLDLTVNPRPRIESIEIVDLTGAGNNSLIINELAIYEITEQRSGGEARLLVKGNAGDSVTAAEFVDAARTEVIDGVTYDVYERGNANLLVQQGVTVLTGGVAPRSISSSKAPVNLVVSLDETSPIASGINSPGESFQAALLQASSDPIEDQLVGPFGPLALQTRLSPPDEFEARFELSPAENSPDLSRDAVDGLDLQKTFLQPVAGGVALTGKLDGPMMETSLDPFETRMLDYFEPALMQTMPARLQPIEDAVAREGTVTQALLVLDFELGLQTEFTPAGETDLIIRTQTTRSEPAPQDGPDTTVYAPPDLWLLPHEVVAIGPHHQTQETVLQGSQTLDASGPARVDPDPADNLKALPRYVADIDVSALGEDLSSEQAIDLNSEHDIDGVELIANLLLRPEPRTISVADDDQDRLSELIPEISEPLLPDSGDDWAG